MASGQRWEFVKIEITVGMKGVVDDDKNVINVGELDIDIKSTNENVKLKYMKIGKMTKIGSKNPNIT